MPGPNKPLIPGGLPRALELALKSIPAATAAGTTVNVKAINEAISNLQAQINALAAAIAALAGGGALTNPLVLPFQINTSLTSIDAYVPVYETAPGIVAPADAEVLASGVAVLGITTEISQFGGGTKVAVLGDVNNGAWAWTAGETVYIGSGSTLLTQSTSPGSYVYPIGCAVSATTIRVFPAAPVFIGSTVPTNMLSLVGGLVTSVSIPATVPVVLHEDGGSDEQTFIVQRFIEAAPPPVVMMLGGDGEDGADGVPLPCAKGTDGATGPMMFARDGEDGEQGMSIPGAKGADGTSGSAGAAGRDGVTIILDAIEPEDPPLIPGPKGADGSGGSGAGAPIDGILLMGG